MTALACINIFIELLYITLKQNILNYVLANSVLYRSTRFNAYSYKFVYMKSFNFLFIQLCLKLILRWINCAVRCRVFQEQFDSVHLFSIITSTLCFFSSTLSSLIFILICTKSVKNSTLSSERISILNSFSWIIFEVVKIYVWLKRNLLNWKLLYKSCTD